MPTTLASAVSLNLKAHPRTLFSDPNPIRTSIASVPVAISVHRSFGGARSRRKNISCEVAALKLESAGDEIPSSLELEVEAAAVAKIGSRVRVKVPLKVYHVPKIPDLDLFGMEGEVKQYVALWKGKRISANLPFKVEFVASGVQGRQGPLKFFVHLKEDEFDYVD